MVNMVEGGTETRVDIFFVFLFFSLLFSPLYLPVFLRHLLNGILLLVIKQSGNFSLTVC